MRTYFLLLGLLCLGLLCTACGGGDSQESLAGETADLMDDVYTIVAKVNDDETAALAKTELDGVAQKHRAIIARILELPKATTDERKAIDQKYKPRAKAFSKKMMGLQETFMLHPELLEPLQAMRQEEKKVG